MYHLALEADPGGNIVMVGQEHDGQAGYDAIVVKLAR
jgi:hypothetical protein